MGQCRLHCLVYGVPLPPLGSFQYNLLYEGIRRERAGKIAFAKFLGRLIAPLSGMEDKQMLVHLSEYAEETYQLKYNWEYQTLRSRIVNEKHIAQSEDMRILRKVAAMTVTDG